MYQPVAAAVHERDLGTIALVGIGAVIGVIVAVPLLRRLLATCHDRTMAVLSGLMLGSLAALWPWKTHTYSAAIPVLGPMQPTGPTGLPWAELVTGCLGAGIVIAARWMVRKRASRHSARHHSANSTC